MQISQAKKEHRAARQTQLRKCRGLLEAVNTEKAKRQECDLLINQEQEIKALRSEIDSLVAERIVLRQQISARDSF